MYKDTTCLENNAGWSATLCETCWRAKPGQSCAFSCFRWLSLFVECRNKTSKSPSVKDKCRTVSKRNKESASSVWVLAGLLAPARLCLCHFGGYRLQIRAFVNLSGSFQDSSDDRVHVFGRKLQKVVWNSFRRGGKGFLKGSTGFWVRKVEERWGGGRMTNGNRMGGYGDRN